jgi:hypothetical protein
VWNADAAYETVSRCKNLSVSNFSRGDFFDGILSIINRIETELFKKNYKKSSVFDAGVI